MRHVCHVAPLPRQTRLREHPGKGVEREWELAGVKRSCERLSSPRDLAVTTVNSLQLWSPAQDKAIKIERFQQPALIGLNGLWRTWRWEVGQVESWGWWPEWGRGGVEVDMAMIYIMRLSKNKQKLTKKKRHYFIALVSLLFVETGPHTVTRPVWTSLCCTCCLGTCNPSTSVSCRLRLQAWVDMFGVHWTDFCNYINALCLSWCKINTCY